jgi:hypothetical protein
VRHGSSAKPNLAAVAGPVFAPDQCGFHLLPNLAGSVELFDIGPQAISCGLVTPAKAIFVPGIFACGLLMYSLKVDSLHTIPELLLGSE